MRLVSLLQSITAGDGSRASGSPCTAARATFIIPNPCPTYNTTVNTTVRPLSYLCSLSPSLIGMETIDVRLCVLEACTPIGAAC